MNRINAKFVSCFLTLFLVLSCTKDRDSSDIPPVPTPTTISELVFVNSRLSLLTEALDRTGLLVTLDIEGPFTFFAPTNEAFERFLQENSYNNIADVPVVLLRNILLNHVIDGQFVITDLFLSPIKTLATQDNSDLNLSMLIDDSSGGFIINGEVNIDINNFDFRASNGVIHIVDGVIKLPTIATLANATAELSTLAEVLPTELVNTLSSEDNLTLLAPNNNAFFNIPEVPTGNALTNLLLNHFINDNLASTDFTAMGPTYSKSMGTYLDTNSLSLYHRIDDNDDLVFNGISKVQEADIVATNGIIHIVDEVVAIPTVVTFATADPDFSTLVSALTTLTPETPFVDILSRTETNNGDMINPPFTIFAPTNMAFDAITVPEEDVLTEVLFHHVASEVNITSGTSTQNGTSTVSTLEGDNLIITLPGTDSNIADVTDGSGNTDLGIIKVDIQAGNGVIHVLNKVAIPNLE
ncbi:fasciclin domain-containing protein [Hyunsoonleella ulvae]|uniref:fasciclin domain-containing protein n=1 Tax=Hyunsoonleella ulvae TaxID=2799948 RepID=UPI00193A94C6|nr:fasciclin domain-containing protein [Hyunsoonleella ulvae]